jgi:hypothetical protein
MSSVALVAAIAGPALFAFWIVEVSARGLTTLLALGAIAGLAIVLAAAIILARRAKWLGIAALGLQLTPALLLGAYAASPLPAPPA